MTAAVKVITRKVKKKGAPAYMVSFGDMMTLILCFFILLVSMATEQRYGMVAKGLGSFIIAVKSHGLNGILDGQERHDIFEQVRRRFNLPPEEDPERREVHELASTFELVRAKTMKALRPRDEVRQPRVATFAPGSSKLDPRALEYLELWADDMRPGRGQTLVLEGHALDGGSPAENAALAFARAAAVRDQLVRRHGHDPQRVLARAWMAELLSADSDHTRSVDARLLLRAKPKDRNED